MDTMRTCVTVGQTQERLLEPLTREPLKKVNIFIESETKQYERNEDIYNRQKVNLGI